MRRHQALVAHLVQRGVKGINGQRASLTPQRAEHEAFGAAQELHVTDDGDGTATLIYRTPSAVFAPYGKVELNEIVGEFDAIFAAIAAQAIGE